MQHAGVLEVVAPSFESVPPSASSFGVEAVELAASAGLYLDPWQAYALDRILAEFDAYIADLKAKGQSGLLDTGMSTDAGQMPDERTT